MNDKPILNLILKIYLQCCHAHNRKNLVLIFWSANSPISTNYAAWKGSRNLKNASHSGSCTKKTTPRTTLSEISNSYYPLQVKPRPTDITDNTPHISNKAKTLHYTSICPLPAKKKMTYPVKTEIWNIWHFTSYSSCSWLIKGFYLKTTVFLEVKPLYNLKIIFYPRDVSGSPITELLTTTEGEMLLSGLKKARNKTCSHKPSQWPSPTLSSLPANPLHFSNLNLVYLSC